MPTPGSDPVHFNNDGSFEDPNKDVPSGFVGEQKLALIATGFAVKEDANELKGNRASAAQVSFGAADVPFFIQDPASSVLAENHQLDDMHPDDAVIDKSLAADFSPSPHVAPADLHGKAPSNAQLALVFHQERQQASFAEVLRRGLVAACEGLLDAGATPISIRLITNVDRMDALGITNCSEEVVGSPDFSSSVQTVLSLSQGGDSGPCSNLQQHDDSVALAVPSTSVRVDSAEGFVLKPILKNSKKPHRSKREKLCLLSSILNPSPPPDSPSLFLFAGASWRRNPSPLLPASPLLQTLNTLS
ncbi:hypothetical protein Nepgr_002810 [Nepenthes gracilis]|uniref:Uncharacterized protein n=1 Tax=Nepenthes gracilis TaxID=150966 RepID=A0AAD3P6X1_NEPGR|nr:hypothetical protein Nepgr_002810 [Nepenthes gracilis]